MPRKKFTKRDAKYIHDVIVGLEKGLHETEGCERLGTCISAVHYAMHEPGKLAELAKMLEEWLQKNVRDVMAERVGLDPETLEKAEHFAREIARVVTHPNSQHDGPPSQN